MGVVEILDPVALKIGALVDPGDRF